jgi:hypothetical protein
MAARMVFSIREVSRVLGLLDEARHLVIVMLELFGFRFICRLDGSRAVITEDGEQALSRSTIDAIAAASRWSNGTE